MPLLMTIRSLVAKECVSKLSSYDAVTDQEFGITYKVPRVSNVGRDRVKPKVSSTEITRSNSNLNPYDSATITFKLTRSYKTSCKLLPMLVYVIETSVKFRDESDK